MLKENTERCCHVLTTPPIVDVNNEKRQNRRLL